MNNYVPTTHSHIDELLAIIEKKRDLCPVYPTTEQLFRALYLTPLDKVSVVIVGQDPYHQPGQADGLAFSSNSIPKSLHNIFTELHNDVGVMPPSTGRLDGWAKQGVLLLNRILSVEESKPLSHQDLGWQAITNDIIHTISSTKDFVVFVLWGAYAQEVIPLIDSRHLILKSPHPSPLSAYRGFFGSKPFSNINKALRAHGVSPIDWASFS